MHYSLYWLILSLFDNAASTVGYKIFALKERYRHLEDLSVDVRVILKQILQNECHGVVWVQPTGCSPVTGSCEHVNEHSCSIKVGKFLEQLSDYQLLKKKSEPVCLSACGFPLITICARCLLTAEAIRLFLGMRWKCTICATKIKHLN
jgi:hypothetical protein